MFKVKLVEIGKGLKDRAITRDLPWGIEVPSGTIGEIAVLFERLEKK